MSEYKNRPFLARLGCALQGLAHGVRSERSLRVQLLALAAALAALGILRPGALWCALVLLSAAVVLAAEARAGPVGAGGGVRWAGAARQRAPDGGGARRAEIGRGGRGAGCAGRARGRGAGSGGAWRCAGAQGGVGEARSVESTVAHFM